MRMRMLAALPGLRESRAGPGVRDMPPQVSAGHGRPATWRNRLAAASLVAALGVLLPIQPMTAQARITPEDTALRLLDIGTTAAGSYLAGKYAMRQRDYEAAAQLLERSLQLDPRAPGVVPHALALFISTGDWEGAEALARRIVRSQPRHRLARMVLGIMAVQRNRFDAARGHFIKAAAAPIGVLSGGMLAAWTWLARPDLREGLESLKILDSYPAFAAFRNYHEALMADLAGHTVRAASTYERAWRENPGSMRLTYAYGNFLRRQGQVKKALAVYRRFLREVPDNAVIRAELEQAQEAPDRKPPAMIRNARDGMAEALFSLTSALMDERSFDSALLHVRMTLALRDDLHVAWMLLGEIEEALGRRAQALQAYRQVPPRHPLHADAQLRSARVLYLLKRTDEAVRALRQLTKQRPDDDRALALLGDILRAEKRWQEATEAYTAAIRSLDKRQRRSWRLLYYRGITYERAGKWEQAERDFRAALDLEPGQPSVLNYLGYSLIERGEKLQEALDMVRRAVQARPGDGYIIDSLGWAYFKLGRYEDAVRELERAVSLMPTDPVINDHLGDAYWMVGRRLEARFQWRHALDGRPSPEPELKRKILDKLAHGLPNTPATKEPQQPEKETSAPLASETPRKPRG